MDLTDFRRNLDIVGKGQERIRKKKLVQEEITAKTTPADAVKELQGQKYDMTNSEIKVSFDASGLDLTNDDNPIGQEKLYNLGRKLKSIDVEPKDELWNEYKEFAGVSGEVSAAKIENLVKFIQSNDNSVQEDDVVNALSKVSGQDISGRQHIDIESAKEALTYFLGDPVKSEPSDEPEADGATLTQKMDAEGKEIEQATIGDVKDHIQSKGGSNQKADQLIQAAGLDANDEQAPLGDNVQKVAQVVANAEDEGTLTPDEEESGEVSGGAQSIVDDFEQVTGPGVYEKAKAAARKAQETGGKSAGSELAKLGAAFLIANGVK